MYIPCKQTVSYRLVKSCLLLVCFIFSTHLAAFASSSDQNQFSDQDLSIQLVNRTPTQIKAFYIARQFNDSAIKEILDTCFVTLIIHNKSKKVLWLELDAWEFSNAGKPFSRLGRDYWPERWQNSALPQAQRATFGWTLLPESRDLRYDESVGGSVVIPAQVSAFTLTMRFPVGVNRKDPAKSITFEGVECIKD